MPKAFNLYIFGGALIGTYVVADSWRRWLIFWLEVNLSAISFKAATVKSRLKRNVTLHLS